MIRPVSFAVCIILIIRATCVLAADRVAGELILFNDNGGWSWFESERVIVDTDAGRILASSVANSAGAGGAARAGDVEVAQYDFESGEVQRFTLCDELQEDDHDSAALLILPDGHYLASYSKHASDNRLRYRISSSPGDATAWQPEQVFHTSGGVTYSNLYYLSKTGTVFNFHRDGGRGFDPNFLQWNLAKDEGFSYGGHLLTGPEGNANNRDRPYLRYVDNGVDRIHFIATDHHPRNLVSNSVYHGYIKAERNGYGVYRSDGRRLGPLNFAENSPYKASEFTPLLIGDAISPANNLRMTRGWTIDIELDKSGNPYTAFSARVDDNDRDHRFFYGRFAGGKWHVHELAKAGGFLYDGENDYTGLVALDPNDPNQVFISTNIDPRSGAALTHYELFQGLTSTAGRTWTWTPITYESSVDNLRPVVPRGAPERTILLWLRGTYTTYKSYDLQVVGLVGLQPIEGIARAGRPARSQSQE